MQALPDDNGPDQGQALAAADSWRADGTQREPEMRIEVRGGASRCFSAPQGPICCSPVHVYKFDLGHKTEPRSDLMCRFVFKQKLGYATTAYIQITMPYAAEYSRFVKPFRLPWVTLSAQVSLLSSACGLTWALEESDS